MNAANTNNEQTPLRETWQVDAGGRIYETTFEEMIQWVHEGALLPQDKVRRGNLRWIEAQKVPSLLEFFNAKERGEPMPVYTSTAAGNQPDETETVASQNASANHYQEFSNFTNSLEQVNISKEIPAMQTPAPTTAPILSEVCCLHGETTAAYCCDTCGNAFCKACPKSYGGNVKICPFCGAMCQSIGKMREQAKRDSQAQAALGENFGAMDFARALAFPLKFKTSFIIGAIMYAFFTFGQSAAGIGGIFLISASLVCFMLANTLTFGILANVINNFSQGRFERNFMPNFDDFSVWDDVVHPFFLSVGAYLSSFGAFLLVCVIAVYLIFSSISEQTKQIQEQVEKIPGTDTFDTSRTVRQSDEVKKLLEGVRTQNQKRLETQEQIAQGNHTPPVSDQTEDDVMRAQELILQTRRQQLEAVAGQTPEDAGGQMAQMFRGILNLAAPLIVVGFLALLWGIFYFPAACAVAGYTRSFTAAINPLVGLDTIKRLGFDYFKIFLMYLTIIVFTVFLGGFLAAIFSPFDLPKLGNIPAKIVGGFITFYFSIVFACILGYAIFKNADKLKIYRG